VSVETAHPIIETPGHAASEIEVVAPAPAVGDVHAFVSGAESTPSSSSEPLAISRRQTRRTRWIVLGVVLVAGVFALWTKGVNPPHIEIGSSGTGSSTVAVAPLDVAAFDAPVWTIASAPEPTKPAPPPPPPPAPLKLQLLGITVEGGQYRAVVFDPDTNKMHIVASGDTVGTRLVQRVEKEEVAFALGAVVQTLTLRPDRTAPLTGGTPR
jgi:hypothetical protein